MTDLWEQQPNEPTKWYDRFVRYLQAGPQRVLIHIVHAEQTAQNQPLSAVPSGTWRDMSRTWQWDERAAAYDRAQIAQAQAAYNAERQAILSNGLALQHKRVQLLIDMAEQLNEFRLDPQRLWLTQTKQIGAGKNTQLIQETVFNVPIIRELRGILDDIAKEVGGRVVKQELTGKDGNALQVHLTLPESEHTSSAVSPSISNTEDAEALLSLGVQGEIILPELEGGAA